MKKLVLPLVVLLLLAGVAAVVATKGMSDKKASDFATNSAYNPEGTTAPEDSATPNPGRYEEYTAQKVAETGFQTTILFFHAGWCPECRAFKKAITSEAIPAGVQVLEVNYDKAADLKRVHGVTLQSTFVKVDQTGNQTAKWVGYGKNKSLQTVLSNL